MGDNHRLEELGIRRDIARKIAIIARQTHIHFDKSVMESGLTRSQWTLIAVVARCPGASQKSIAEHLEISEASAGRLIDRLCSDGLLERRQHEDDRRSWQVYLTEATKPLLAQISGLATDLEKQLFVDFSDEDLTRFQSYLEVMYQNVGRMREGPRT